MTIMDDFVKRTEEGIRTLRETAEGIAVSVEKQAKIATRKMDIVRVQRRIRKVYTEIGEYVYGEYVVERPLASDNPFIRERMATVTEQKLEIERIEAEIESIRGQSPPDEKGRGPEEKTP